MKFLSTGNAVYNLNYQLVIITRGRKNILNKDMIDYFKEVVSNIINKNGGELIFVTGEPDWIRIIFEISPTISLTKLVNVIKGTSSRMLRKKFHIVSKNNRWVLWDCSYLILSQSIQNEEEEISTYIMNQGNKTKPPHES